MFYLNNLLSELRGRLDRDEKGQWNVNGPVGLLVTVIVVVVLIIILFKVLDRV